jgi:subtilase family serine protease
MRRRASRAFRPRLDTLDDRRLLSALTPAQVTQAYGLNGITFNANGQTVKGNGSGQVIALVEAYHDPNLASDLQTFDRAFNLPTPYLVQKDLAGSATDDGWAEEEMLDVEWAHAIAPAAQIIVVEARSDGFWDLMSRSSR